MSSLSENVFTTFGNLLYNAAIWFSIYKNQAVVFFAITGIAFTLILYSLVAFLWDRYVSLINLEETVPTVQKQKTPSKVPGAHVFQAGKPVLERSQLVDIRNEPTTGKGDPSSADTLDKGIPKKHAISMVDVVPRLRALLDKFLEDYNPIYGMSATGQLRKTEKDEHRGISFTLAASNKTNTSVEILLSRTDIKVTASWQKAQAKLKDGGTSFGLEDTDAVEKHLWGLIRTLK